MPGATGYLDTDYAAKGRYADRRARTRYDFVVVHVEATDEASHEGDADEKVKALEQIDADIVGPLHRVSAEAGRLSDSRLPGSSHVRAARKTHSHGFVPFTMCGSGLAATAAP